MVSALRPAGALLAAVAAWALCLAVLAVLGLAPVLWVWSSRLRRLTGPDQLGANLAGCSTSLALAGAAAAALLSGVV